MRKILFIAAITAIAFIHPALAQQNMSSISNIAAPVPPPPPERDRTISVNGEAEVKVVPDQVQISLTAENRGRDLLETQAENDKAVKGLVEYATKTLGIEARHVQ